MGGGGNPDTWAEAACHGGSGTIRAQIAPCRQFGSSRTDNLVIAAHNYDTHFGKLKELSKGDTVIFTDMEGIVSTYCIEKLETLSPDAVDTVLNSGYDLVSIPAPRASGKTRVTVFCDRTAKITLHQRPSKLENEVERNKAFAWYLAHVDWTSKDTLKSASNMIS